MIKFAIRRTLQAIPIFLGITFIAYMIMLLAPGSPATQLGFNPDLTARQRAALAESMGANTPPHIMYLSWLLGDQPIAVGGLVLWQGRELPVFDRRGNQIGTELGTGMGILRGDFGISITSRRPALETILIHLPATLELGLISFAIGFTLGIIVGVLSAVWQGSLFDQFSRIMAVLVSAIPVFWLGLILLLIFGSWLQWLPMGGRFPASLSGEYTAWERISRLILPVFTLASFSIATFSRFMRASLLDVLNQDYVRTAKAKGLGDRTVWFKHALRNALIPIATLFGPALTGVVSGAVLTETIYSWPGMGRLLVNSVQQLDYAIIMGTVILITAATIVGYLLSDILYAVLDPRIRLS